MTRTTSVLTSLWGRTSVAHGLAAVLAAGVALAAFSDGAIAQRKHAAIVVDANTGATLSQSHADEPRYPASLTKMMTIYLAFEALERKRVTAQTPIKISERAAGARPSKLNLEPGETIALIDAVRALVVKSANDVAIAVAEHLGGTEEKFARDMTAKARQLGMRNTTFRNASGLPDDGQVTTARDMVILGLRLQDDFPQLYALFATREFTYNGKTYRSHNNLLGRYEGTDGIKTGYISASGFNLVSNVKRGQKHVIGAVFGGPSASQRDQTMRHLLNLGLFKASATKTRQPVRRPADAPAVAMRRVPAAAPVPASVPAPRVAVAPAALPVPAARPVPKPDAAKLADADTLSVPTLAQTLHPSGHPVQPAPPPKLAVARVKTVPIAVSAGEPPAPGRGTPPATLQAQAKHLSGGAPAPQRTAALSPPVTHLGGPATTAPKGRALQIQVGAHKSKADAERHLAAVKIKAGATLAPYSGRTIEAKTAQGPVYRVRFSGLDASRAADVCNDLRRQQIDCLVTQAE